MYGLLMSLEERIIGDFGRRELRNKHWKLEADEKGKGVGK